MAVGATLVIISGGIDSIRLGSIYALAGDRDGDVALVRSWQFSNPLVNVLAALTLCLGIGLLCGKLANGVMVVGLPGPSIYYHTGHDVGLSRDRVRDHQGRKHPRARCVDQRGQDDLRVEFRPVPRADAGDDRGHGARGGLSFRGR